MKGWIAGPELRDDLPEPAGDVVAVKATSQSPMVAAIGRVSAGARSLSAGTRMGQAMMSTRSWLRAAM